MDPNVWGKHMWTSIHFIALAYPQSPTQVEQSDYSFFFNNLYKVLPCKSCREHLDKTMKNEHQLNKEHLKNKDTLFKWTVDLHNIVNRRLKKKVISLEKAISTYMKKSEFSEAMCPSSSEKHKNINDDTIIKSKLLRLMYMILFLLLVSILLNIYYFIVIRRG